MSARTKARSLARCRNRPLLQRRGVLLRIGNVQLWIGQQVFAHLHDPQVNAAIRRAAEVFRERNQL